jgi:uncharacterized protein
MYLAEGDLAEAVGRVEDAGGRCLSAPADGHGGRTAIVVDAAGATLGLWQAADFPGAQVAGESGAMTWPELLTDDPAAAVDFYARAFGWVLREEYGSDGSRGEWLTPAHDAVAGLAPGGELPRWRSAFQVADCERAIARCGQLGGELVVGPLEMGFGSYAELVDPWGVRFAVAALAAPAIRLSLAFNPVTGMEVTFPG